jgi:hypothetical protein
MSFIDSQADSGSATEGSTTEAIESQTAKIPSDLFLVAAGGAMAVSLAFKLAKKSHVSLFFGQWVAPLLLFGVYNKIVKTLGHDQEDNGISATSSYATS